MKYEMRVTRTVDYKIIRDDDEITTLDEAYEKWDRIYDDILFDTDEAYSSENCEIMDVETEVNDIIEVE